MTYPESEVSLDPEDVATYSCDTYNVFASAQGALGTIQGSHIGYSRVEEIIGEYSNDIGKQVYIFENTPGGTGSLWDTQNGTLMETQTYDNQNRPVKKVKNNYSFKKGLNCPGGCNGGSSTEIRSPTTCDFSNSYQPGNDNRAQLCKLASGGYEWRVTTYSGYTESCTETAIFKAKFIRKGYLIEEVWKKLESNETWDYFYDSGAQQQVYNKTDFEYTDNQIGQPTAIYFTNPLDKIRYSYTERGWLNQMNDIVYLEDGAGLCDDPVPTKPKQIEQEVDLEDLLDLIVSDPKLVINSLDPCEVTDCFERRASYRITVQNPTSTDPAKYVNVDACIEQLYGETGAIPLPNYPYCLFTQNEVNLFITDLSAWLDSGYVYDEISSSYNSATKTYTIDIIGTNYEFTDIGVECLRNFYFVLPKPQPNPPEPVTNNIIEVKYGGDQDVPLGYYCWGQGSQFATYLKTWLQNENYIISDVTYVSAGRDIGKMSILGTNFPLERVVTCIDCGDYTETDCPKTGGSKYYSLPNCWGYLEKRNQELRPCKFPPGTNPGTDVQQPASIDDLDNIIDASTPANVPLPNVLYQVKLLDGSIRWVFKTELGTIKGNYDRLTEIPVTSSDQIFTIKKTDGSTIQTDLAGLLNERKLGTIDDIPVPPTTPPPAADPCAPLAPLGCTDLEQQAQNQSLALILNDMASLDVSTLQYPVQIHLVRLCDGSTAYILDQFLGDLEGSHLTIGSITVTSPDQLFNVTAVQPEPIFAMAFNHEANGNISRAEWQTTFHRSQFYDYAYDPLNRLLSAQYGEVVPSYAVVGGAFQKFVYQINNNYNENNLTYDGDGNIKTLQRMGLSDANNCASKVQIDNLLYTLIPGTPRLQKVADSAPTANRAKGFNPGASPGSDYVYDQNGNLTTDPYKGLTIQYNFLNLPKLITKGGSNMTIRYDATGKKWSQSSPEGIREYVGGIEYVDQKIQSVQHSEGRLVVAFNTSGTAIESIRSEYWRQDHLGNTRVAFSDFNLDGVITTKDDPNTTGNDIEITQESHFYPFGLSLEGPWYETVQPKNKYLFNGIERVEDLGINLDLAVFRSYDPAVGRWWQVDPLAEKYYGMTPYNGMGNNPMLFADMLGDSINVSNLRDKNPGAWNTIKADLEVFTGLSLSVDDNGNLSYKEPEGEVSGSKRARKRLIKAIKHKETVQVKDDEDGTGSHVPMDASSKELQNTIYINSEQLQDFVDGASPDLDPRSYGFGMNFFHELGHTRVGGRKTDGGHDTAGDNVKNVNVIRRQLGSSFGKRVVYTQFRTTGDPGNEYYPFSKIAHKALLQNKIPSSGYIKVPIK